MYKRSSVVTTILLVLAANLTTHSSLGQIHIIRANGVRLYVPSGIPSTEGSDSLLNIDDPSGYVIAMDYDSLTVTMSRNDEKLRSCSITDIVRRPEGLECIFLDSETGVRYELRYFNNHHGLNMPLLSITWNDTTPDSRQHALIATDVSLY